MTDRMDQAVRDRVQVESEHARAAAPPIETLLRQARSRRRKSVARVVVGAGVVGVVAVAVLTSVQRGDSPEPAGATEQADAFELPHFPKSFAGDQALLAGILEFDENDCPVLARSSGRTYLNFLDGTVSGSRDTDGTRRLIGANGDIWGTEGRRVYFGGGGRGAGVGGWAPRCGPDQHQGLVSERGSPGGSAGLGLADEAGCTGGRSADLDVPGPGQPSPEQAVEEMTTGQLTVIRSAGSTATVEVSSAAGDVLSVYTVRELRDGWWPQAYIDCS